MVFKIIIFTFFSIAKALLENLVMELLREREAREADVEKWKSKYALAQLHLFTLKKQFNLIED